MRRARGRAGTIGLMVGLTFPRIATAAGCTLALLVALPIGRTPSAQTRQASGPDLASISASRIVAHATFLADDLLEGRAPGARGPPRASTLLGPAARRRQ